jgi:hypothetical protein
MKTCHLCSHTIPSHHDDCRSHQDLQRFERVYLRLSEQGGNDTLRDKLARQLSHHGRLAAEA